MHIGERIKHLRRKFGLKQTDLANSFRISPQAVSKWERGESVPDVLSIRQLAQLFNVSTDYLLGMYEETREVFEATVFCSSFNGFAHKAERCSAKELAEWTNIAFHHMTQVVLECGGVPVKYTGDGFLCFFSGSDHRQRAVKAAKHIKKFNGDQNLVIFLHTGQIYLGMIGHCDYASRDICGNTVNRAFLYRDWFARRVKCGIGITTQVKDGLTKQYTYTTYSYEGTACLGDGETIYELVK